MLLYFFTEPTTTDTYRVQSNSRPANQHYTNNKNSKAAKQLYNTSPSLSTGIDIQNAKNKGMYNHSYTPLTTFSSLPHSVEIQQTKLDNSAHQQGLLWGNRSESFGNIDNGKGQYQAMRTAGSQKSNGGNMCREYISSHNKGPFEEQLVYFPVNQGGEQLNKNTPQNGNNQLTRTGNQNESWMGREGSIRATQDGRRHLFGNHPFSDDPLHEDDKNLTLSGQKSAFRAPGSLNNTLNSKKKEVRFADKCLELHGRCNSDGEEATESVDDLSEDGVSITSGSYVLVSENGLTGDTFV